MPSSRERRIDLNADVGEGPGEEPLFALITSANIACGGHAGTIDTMRDAVGLAARSGVAIGAHPSYPDREGFGRVPMSFAAPELADIVARQIEQLVRVARDAGASVTHVKPHGALYNEAASRPEIADAVASGVALVSADLIVVGLAGSQALRVWRERGLAVAAEGFADRAYAADGTLVPRTLPGALITDPEAAAAQAVRLADSRACATICLHGDTIGAVAIASAVRRRLEEAGIVLAALAGSVTPRHRGGSGRA
jgi:UPF0271 protein